MRSEQEVINAMQILKDAMAEAGLRELGLGWGNSESATVTVPRAVRPFVVALRALEFVLEHRNKVVDKLPSLTDQDRQRWEHIRIEEELTRTTGILPSVLENSSQLQGREVQQRGFKVEDHQDEHGFGAEKG